VNNESEKESSKTLKHLSDTRWALRKNSLDAIKSGYMAVIKSLEHIEDNDFTDRGAKAAGLLSAVKKYDFLFNIYALQAVLAKTDVLNKSLQSKQLDIAIALQLAECTIKQLIEIKSTDFFKTEIFEPTI